MRTSPASPIPIPIPHCTRHLRVLAVALVLGAALVLTGAVFAQEPGESSGGERDKYSIERRPDGRVDVWVELPSGEDSLVVTFTGKSRAEIDSLLETLDGDWDRVEVTPPKDSRRISGGSSDLVRVGEGITVERDEVVNGDVVAVGGSARIAGTVRGNVVAVGGNVHLDSTAVVTEDAVAVGGRLRSKPGARVMGEEVSVGVFSPEIWGGGDWGWGAPTGIEFIFWLVLFIGAFFFGWLIYALTSRRMENIRATIERRFFLSLIMGLLAFPGSFLLFLLLLITIIGIPAALILPLLMIIFTFMGFIAIMWSIGRAILGAIRDRAPNFELGLAFGLLILFVLMQIANVLDWISLPGAGLFGYLVTALTMVITSVGLGAVLVSRIGNRPHPATAGGAPPPGGAVPATGAPPAAPPAAPVPPAPPVVPPPAPPAAPPTPPAPPAPPPDAPPTSPRSIAPPDGGVPPVSGDPFLPKSS